MRNKTNAHCIAMACLILTACHNSSNTGDHESKHDPTPPGSYSVPALNASNDSGRSSPDTNTNAKRDLSKPRRGQNTSGNKTNFSSPEAIKSHNRAEVVGHNADKQKK